MEKTQALDIADFISAQAIGRRQWLVIALCAAVAVLDGMDVQSIGLAAAGIGADLHIATSSFGAVFSAALAGLALGALFLGPIADRIGRKQVLLGSTFTFGLFTLATATSQTFSQLLAFRFLAGVGLGGAMPSFIAIASEYVPARHRASIVSLVWVGFPLGGVVGGLLGGQIIPAFGWHSIFWVGGILPIAFVFVLAALMPESLAWLVHNQGRSDKIASTLTWMFPGHDFKGTRRYEYSGVESHSKSVAELFNNGRAGGTLLLWVAFFFVFLILVVNSSWTPLLLKSLDISVQQSSLAMAAYNFGSIVGSAAAGYLMARYHIKSVLFISIVAGAIAYAVVGWTAPALAGIFAGEALFGLLMGCGSAGLIGLGAVFYPSAVRSTGVGWATAAGRIGSFCGPLLIGALLGHGLSPSTIFILLALGAGISAVACLILRFPGYGDEGQKQKPALAG